MKFSIRFTLLFILFSLAGMFVFSFTMEDYYSASIPGKINTVLFPLLVLAGSLYTNTISFNRDSNKIIINSGIYPFIRRKVYSFSNLEAVIFNPIGDPEKDNTFLRISGRKYMFGFKMESGNYIILERSGNEKTTTAFYRAFMNFFPHSVETIK